MAQIDRVKALGAGAIAVALALSICSIADAASVQADTDTETALNPHNFALKLEMFNFVDGAWSGDATFTISACPEKDCFRLSGPLKIVPAPKNKIADEEGFFPIAGSPCVLHFEQISYDGMDSGDYRLTPVSKDKGAKGCSSLPAGLAGVYKQVIKQSEAEGPRFQLFSEKPFEALASKTDAACPDAHVRFFNSGDLAWEEESFTEKLMSGDRARVMTAIKRTTDGAPRSCENSSGLSCSASANLEAIEKAGQMERFATFVCATKPPQ